MTTTLHDETPAAGSGRGITRRHGHSQQRGSLTRPPRPQAAEIIGVLQAPGWRVAYLIDDIEVSNPEPIIGWLAVRRTTRALDVELLPMTATRTIDRDELNELTTVLIAPDGRVELVGIANYHSLAALERALVRQQKRK
jgi:hypothetical protein